MKQLGNQDAGFVYNETPNTPMHISGLGIYDQSTAPKGLLGHKDILKYMQDRLHLAPIFRYKFVEVPFGLDKPYWIDDPDFDIEFHVRHIALPHPGDWRQLCILVSRLNSRPLDFSRPLWEAYIIEGLDNVEGLPKGSFAIMVKVHHSIVDGASGQSVFAALHDLSPDATAPISSAPLMVDRIPTSLELIGRAMPNMIRKPISQTTAFYRKAPNLIRGALRLYKGTLKSGTKLKVPPTRFNQAISPHRVFEGTCFSLDDIKYVKNTVGQGTTVNDVMLNVIAGGMQKYLAAHNEVPEGSLCAMLPQDIRSEATKNVQGNQVGGIFADLHSDVNNPIDRLVAIHESTGLAKQLALEVDTAALVQNYMGGFFNPSMGKRFNRLLQSSRLIERFGPFACNTLITNVPGPNFPLYHAGAKMVAYWAIPPLTDCLGLGHAIFSYCGRISLSAFSCRSMMPDPDFYMQCLNQSFDEILTAARELEAQLARKDEEPEPESVPHPAPRRRAARKASSSKASAASAAAPAAAPAEKKVEAAVAPAPVRRRASRKASSSSAKPAA
jgi:diacylglycerol O-acyltransferase